MIEAIFLLLGGLLVLSLGAHWAVGGALQVSDRFKLSRGFVAVSVIALGTSLPEGVVTIMASLEEVGQLAWGNIVGSNIANIGLVLAVAALISPIKWDRREAGVQLPGLVVISLLFYVFMRDAYLSRLDGGILLGVFVFIFICLIRGENSYQDEMEEVQKKQVSLFAIAAVTIFGISGLIWGASSFVEGAVEIAEFFGVSELVIGLTVAAVGTSLPELAAALASSLKKENELTVGNVLGSNIMNVSLVLALAALIRPMRIETPILDGQLNFFLFFSLLAAVFAGTSKTFTRIKAVTLFVGYLVYLYWLKVGV